MRDFLTSGTLIVVGIAAALMAACTMPPQTVDPLASLGVAPATASGSVDNLKGRDIALVLGPNLVARIEYDKSAKETGALNPVITHFAGGKEQLGARHESNVYILPLAAMLKTYFPQIRLTKSIAEAETTGAAATVLVDLSKDQQSQGMSRTIQTWSGRFDFLVPASSRAVHRTIEVSHEKSCPLPSGDGSAFNLCYSAARDEMLAMLKTRLDDAMSGK